MCVYCSVCVFIQKIPRVIKKKVHRPPPNPETRLGLCEHVTFYTPLACFLCPNKYLDRDVHGHKIRFRASQQLTFYLNNISWEHFLITKHRLLRSLLNGDVRYCANRFEVM